jgi:hypothetical protein
MRPFPLPSDIAAKELRPAAYVARAASASLRGFLTGANPINIAKSMWDDDRVTPLILRGSTGPATTTGANWASQLAGIAIVDLIQSITSLSAAAQLIDRALLINLDGIAEARIPARVLSASAAGQWVPEGGAAPVRSLSFANAAVLRPRRLVVISPYTTEMAESSNLEAIIKQTLGESTGLALDARLFSNTAADAAGPGGLFSGVSPIAATTGGGDNAMHGDIAALFAALAANGAGKTAVIVAAMPQAVRLKMMAGPKFDYDIIASTQIAAGTIALIESGSFVSGFGSTAEFDVTKVSALHFEDTAPADFPAAPMKSLFQIDALAQRTHVWAAWGMRAANHVAWIQNTTW